MLAFVKRLIINCLLLLVVMANGCDLFRTRLPEEPSTSQFTYQPATSAQIVILNLVYAIKEKNIENYLSCLSAYSNDSERTFVFVPSADVSILYSNIFDDWSINKERQYFASLVSILSRDVNPTLLLSNTRYEILLPDSALYVGEYELNIVHNVNNLPKQVKGVVQLTMYPNKNGIWSIGKWVDITLPNDTTSHTWSFLKAVLSN